VSDALAKNKILAAEVIEDKRSTEKAEEEATLAGDVKEADGKLVVKEEIEEGHVSFSACASFHSSTVQPS